MLLTRTQPADKCGIFFAIWPRRTPDGWVALEWLHWTLIESWGWGSGESYSYRRIKYKHGAETPPSPPTLLNKFWAAWFALPIEDRRRIQASMVEDPL
jgi:hypothetical protein